MAELKEDDRVVILPNIKDAWLYYPWAEIGMSGVVIHVRRDAFSNEAHMYVVRCKCGGVYDARPEEVGLETDPAWMEKVHLAQIREVQDG